MTLQFDQFEELSALFKEKSVNGRRIRRHSAVPSLEGTPVQENIKKIFPLVVKYVHRFLILKKTPTKDKVELRRRNPRRNTDRTRRRLLSGSSSASKEEILDEVSNILKSSDRLDRMMRSDDAISRILLHIKSDSESDSNESDRRRDVKNVLFSLDFG